MLKAVFVVAIMVIINIFMVFAVFKVAARLDDSLRRYFVVKIGDSEYSKVRVNNAYGTIVGEEGTDGEGDGQYNGEGEGLGGEGSLGGQGQGKDLGIGTSFADDQIINRPKTEIGGEMMQTMSTLPNTQNIYNRVDLETERIRKEQELDTVSTIPSAEDISVARYKNNDLKSDYKTIRQLSSLDKASAVEAVQNVQTLEGEEHSKVVLSIKDILDYDTVFRLASMDNNIQEDILRQCFNQDQQKILDDYLSQIPGLFDAVDFFGYIQNLSEMCDTNYYVYTSNENEQYVGLGENVTPIYDDEIAEGIKVVYRNKLYDYSI